jgi:uncharacterized membrane protein YdjX (TVP38/TMEM64 family)
LAPKTVFDTSPYGKAVTLPKALTYLWIALLIGVLIFWITDSSAFSEGALESTLRGWGSWAFAGFALISLVRGALLIPSTPVVLAGGALFPDAVLLVLIISMAGIVLSAALLYRFPGFAGYDKKLAAKYPEQLARLQVHLTKPRAQWFVALWAFLPIVPTDLICYAAGLVRMPFRRMMTGIIIGEVPLVTAYILVGKQAAELLSL